MDKINLFGYASNDIVYGGSGSGNGDTSQDIDLVQVLENNGFEVNEELQNLYEDNYVVRKPQGFTVIDYSIYELPTSKYSDELIANAKEYSDTDFVVIGRVGGEGYDLPLDMADYEGGDA